MNKIILFDCNFNLAIKVSKLHIENFELNLISVSIWRRRRKILLPTFSPKILETFVEVFSEQSEKLVSRLGERAPQSSFSIWPFVSSYTLDSVCGELILKNNCDLSDFQFYLNI